MRELVNGIASGELRGDAAFEAVVEWLLEREIPVDATPDQIDRLQEQVILGVSRDQALCDRLFQDDVDPRLIEKRTRPGRRPRIRHEAPARALVEPDAVESARRPNGLWVGIVVAACGAVLLGSWWIKPTPCDSLAERICSESSDPVCDVRATLTTRDVATRTCQLTLSALDVALTNVDPADIPSVYRDTLVEQLGFDPRGGPVELEANPEPKLVQPLMLVTGQTSMTGLVVDRTYAYWTRAESAGVFRARNIGFEPGRVAIEQRNLHPTPTDLTVTDDYVYWLSRTPDARTLWIDTKNPTPRPVAIPMGPVSPDRAAFLGSEVAVVDDVGALFIAPVSGGEPRQLLAATKPSATALVGDEVSVYWFTPVRGGELTTIPRQGGVVRIMARAVGSLRGLTSHGAFLYGINTTSGALQRWPKAGGTAETLVSDGLQDAFGLAVDDDHVYWTQPVEGIVGTVPVSGGPTRLFATAQAEPRWIALDRAAVYWEASGALFRLPKVKTATP